MNAFCCSTHLDVGSPEACCGWRDGSIHISLKAKRKKTVLPIAVPAVHTPCVYRLVTRQAMRFPTFTVQIRDDIRKTVPVFCCRAVHDLKLWLTSSPRVFSTWQYLQNTAPRNCVNLVPPAPKLMHCAKSAFPNPRANTSVTTIGGDMIPMTHPTLLYERAGVAFTYYIGADAAKRHRDIRTN
nr:hypothetical protein CFP56_75979 [Quercus suber]